MSKSVREKSNLELFAERELALGFPPGQDEDDSMQRLINENIMELIRVFSDQGHSGFSAPYVLKYFIRLANWKPILPLTGEEDEWSDPYDPENETQQNKRYPSVFRHHHDNSTAYDIDGKIFIDKDGLSYRTKECDVPVTFPYEVPDKPEYIHKEPDDE